jgi:hypothetical protein
MGDIARFLDILSYNWQKASAPINKQRNKKTRKHQEKFEKVY